MSNKKIKVIKKKDLSLKNLRELPVESEGKENPRTMVSTVSSWVNDFQRRKREETKKGFETLLSSSPESVSS